MWACLAVPLSLSPSELRHKVVAGSHVSLAYLDSKVFTTLSGLPWSLCLGDIETNLKDLLMQDDVPTEVTARKIWCLGKNGYDSSKLVDALYAMRELSFTSHLTEKLHASAALVKRHHPDYGPRTTEMRAFIHSFRHLWTANTDVYSLSPPPQLLPALPKPTLRLPLRFLSGTFSCPPPPTQLVSIRADSKRSLQCCLEVSIPYTGSCCQTPTPAPLHTLGHCPADSAKLAQSRRVASQGVMCYLPKP